MSDKFLETIQQGYTFKGDKVKLELGIGKGKKLYDKRQDIAKKDAQMKIQRAARFLDLESLCATP